MLRNCKVFGGIIFIIHHYSLFLLLSIIYTHINTRLRSADGLVVYFVRQLHFKIKGKGQREGHT